MKSLEGTDAGSVAQYGPLNASSTIIQAPSEIANEFQLHIPLSKTFPAIDGVLVIPSARHIIFAQSTVSTAHPIKYTPLEHVYEHLAQRQEFEGYKFVLLFIVPSDIYGKFAYQHYENGDGKNRSTIHIKVKQYVGKII